MSREILKLGQYDSVGFDKAEKMLGTGLDILLREKRQLEAQVAAKTEEKYRICERWEQSSRELVQARLFCEANKQNIDVEEKNYAEVDNHMTKLQRSLDTQKKALLTDEDSIRVAKFEHFSDNKQIINDLMDANKQWYVQLKDLAEKSEEDLVTELQALEVKGDEQNNISESMLSLKSNRHILDLMSKATEFLRKLFLNEVEYTKKLINEIN